MDLPTVAPRRALISSVDGQSGADRTVSRPGRVRRRRDLPSAGPLGDDKQSVADRFNIDTSIDLLLLTTHLGGVGLTLTGADVVFFVDRDLGRSTFNWKYHYALAS
ncbi:SNF2 family DNA-dependent ATPase domain-containing protein [Aphelenchoides avenae]|nr:SNF2 family DNA-dependent ATPase domain-containing protein [Aphelenchus avenae]